VLAMLGAPGGSGSAHVVQLGPVRVERDRDEVAPGRANPVKPSAVIPLFDSVGGWRRYAGRHGRFCRFASRASCWKAAVISPIPIFFGEFD